MENQKASSRHKPLALVDMASAFVILGLGISLSVLVFLIELIYKRIKNHYFDEDDVIVIKQQVINNVPTTFPSSEPKKVVPATFNNAKNSPDGIKNEKKTLETNNKQGLTITAEAHPIVKDQPRQHEQGIPGKI